jgi:hypothetical protein
MSSLKVNPFYIDPNQDDEEVDADEWGWGDDTDDLEELLGDGESDQYPPPKNGRQSSTPFPVRNSGYESESNKTRIYLISACLLFIMIIIILFPNDKEVSKNENLPLSPNAEKSAPRIVVIGERHSGLEWLERSLTLCFPNSTVSSKLSRTGYFFQNDPKDPSIHVVAIANNPYEWVESMRTHPQYMPNHANILNWKEFLIKEWSIKRPDRDLEYERKEGPICQLNFSYNEVISCVEDPHEDSLKNPIYELKRDGSGEPFKSILELRAAKLQNHAQEIRPWVRNITTIQYESLTKDTIDKDGKLVPGIYQLLQDLRFSLKMEWSCNLDKAKSFWNQFSLTDDFISFINDNVDWDAEALFGFKPLKIKSESISQTDDNTSKISNSKGLDAKNIDESVGVADDDAPIETSDESSNSKSMPTTATVKTKSPSKSQTSLPSASQQFTNDDIDSKENYDFETSTDTPEVVGKSTDQDGFVEENKVGGNGDKIIGENNDDSPDDDGDHKELGNEAIGNNQARSGDSRNKSDSKKDPGNDSKNKSNGASGDDSTDGSVDNNPDENEGYGNDSSDKNDNDIEGPGDDNSDQNEGSGDDSTNQNEDDGLEDDSTSQNKDDGSGDDATDQNEDDRSGDDGTVQNEDDGSGDGESDKKTDKKNDEGSGDDSTDQNVDDGSGDGESDKKNDEGSGDDPADQNVDDGSGDGESDKKIDEGSGDDSTDQNEDDGSGDGESDKKIDDGSGDDSTDQNEDDGSGDGESDKKTDKKNDEGSGDDSTDQSEDDGSGDGESDKKNDEGSGDDSTDQNVDDGSGDGESDKKIDEGSGDDSTDQNVDDGSGDGESDKKIDEGSGDDSIDQNENENFGDHSVDQNSDGSGDGKTDENEGAGDASTNQNDYSDEGSSDDNTDDNEDEGFSDNSNQKGNNESGSRHDDMIESNNQVSGNRNADKSIRTDGNKSGKNAIIHDGTEDTLSDNLKKRPHGNVENDKEVIENVVDRDGIPIDEVMHEDDGNMMYSPEAPSEKAKSPSSIFTHMPPTHATAKPSPRPSRAPIVYKSIILTSAPSGLLSATPSINANQNLDPSTAILGQPSEKQESKEEISRSKDESGTVPNIPNVVDGKSKEHTSKRKKHHNSEEHTQNSSGGASIEKHKKHKKHKKDNDGENETL